MADHNNLVRPFSHLKLVLVCFMLTLVLTVLFFQPSPDDINGLDDQSMKEKLRKVLKRMGKLKCSKEV